MIGENWQLVTNEPIEFEKYLVEVQDCRKNCRSFQKNLKNIPQFKKGNPKDVNMQPVGLANTRISTNYAQNPPQSLLRISIYKVWINLLSS
jgi:hypothetical protein